MELFSATPFCKSDGTTLCLHVRRRPIRRIMRAHFVLPDHKVYFVVVSGTSKDAALVLYVKCAMEMTSKVLVSSHILDILCIIKAHIHLKHGVCDE